MRRGEGLQGALSLGLCTSRSAPSDTAAVMLPNATVGPGFGTEQKQHQPLARRRSLVDDARSESAKNRDARIQDLRQEGAAIKYYDLTEEEIVLLSRQLGCDSRRGDAVSIGLVFSIREELLDGLPDVLARIQRHGGKVDHLETRSGRPTAGQDVFVRLSIPSKGLLSLIRTTRQDDRSSVALLDEGICGSSRKAAWYPRHISELDQCAHVSVQVEPDLDSSHPGFGDAAYRARRAEITRMASEYKQGEPIPRVDYTDEEIKTWGTVFGRLHALYPKHACSAYQRAFQRLEEECCYRPDNIPQLQDVSAFLKRRSGFVLRPAAGLVGARDFLSSLAFRVFQCTQYVRHSSSPHHTPEPDCIHELLGHAPMLADPEFACFSQEIGLASLGVSDQDIERLATVYWFTVEFGLCQERGEVKAYGAGLLSSFGELQHAVSDRPRLLPFHPESTSLHPYQDQDFQDVYFVAESFQDAQDKIRDFVRHHIRRPFDVAYDPYRESVLEMDCLQKVEDRMDDLGTNLGAVRDALQRLRCHPL